MLRVNLCVALVALFAVALTAGQSNADITIFQETFDANTAAEFYSTDPTNYGAWSEYPPAVTPYSDPAWSVAGGRLIGDTPLGAGSFPNTVAREISVPAGVANGSAPFRIEFDAQILQGGGYDPGGGNYGSYMGVLTGNIVTSLHSGGSMFGPIRYSDWNINTIADPWFVDNGFVPDGVVQWDMLFEPAGGGVYDVTATVSQGASSYTDNWSTTNDPSAFQFVDGKFRLGFMGDDGSGASAVSIAYDNLQVTSTIPEPSSLTLIGVGLLMLVVYAWRRKA